MSNTSCRENHHPVVANVLLHQLDSMWPLAHVSSLIQRRGVACGITHVLIGGKYNLRKRSKIDCILLSIRSASSVRDHVRDHVLGQLIDGPVRVKIVQALYSAVNEPRVLPKCEATWIFEGHLIFVIFGWLISSRASERSYLDLPTIWTLLVS